MILTNNALVSSSQSLPAWAAVGVVPRATHIWSVEDAASKKVNNPGGIVRITLKSSPFFFNRLQLHISLCGFTVFTIPFVLTPPS